MIFARGSALFSTDARGQGRDRDRARSPAKATVRALRTDARGTVLLADIGGKWSWMPLDGSTTTLTELPCDDGPAQLADDGACVLCRVAGEPTGSVIVNLATGKQSRRSTIPAPGRAARRRRRRAPARVGRQRRRVVRAARRSAQEDHRSRPRRRCAASCRAPTARARSASTSTRSTSGAQTRSPPSC